MIFLRLEEPKWSDQQHNSFLGNNRHLDLVHYFISVLFTSHTTHTDFFEFSSFEVVLLPMIGVHDLNLEIMEHHQSSADFCVHSPVSGRVRSALICTIMNQLLCYILNKRQEYCKVSFYLVWYHLEKIDYLEMFGRCQVQFVPEF